MPESPSSHQMRIPPERSGRWRRGEDPARDELARAIPRRAQVSWWIAIVLAAGFAAIVTPAITAERWLGRFQPGTVVEKQPAPFTVRAPMLAGYDHLRVGGGVVVARGELATHDEAAICDAIAAAMPRGPALYGALFALTFVLAAIFSHHMRRSNKGRLVRVQLVSLAVIALLAILAKALMLATALSALVVPVAVLAMIPTMVLDRVVGIATGVLAALVVSLLAPFDVGLAILLLVQAATAGLMVAERPKQRWTPALSAGLVTTLCTGAMYLLLTYLTTGHAPELHDPLHSAWLAAVLGPLIAAFVVVPLIPLYQLLVGEITQGRLIALEDLSHPLLRQIAEKSPGTWQHSLMMANMAEIAANAIGASGRLVRVGAYFHDLGKSLSPKYFIENLEAGETSPHDQLPPEVSCDAIFAHVSEGIVAARKAGLHERIVDFMHMHHGNGVLEYFWAKCKEQGNPHGYVLEQFRYPGHPPQSRETAILTICDAVEAASRTLKKPDAASIDSLVQRIVYGKLHLGQLDESGLSMSDLRRISDSLRETIRHANHGRIEYPWQKAEQDASASAPGPGMTSTAPRLDSLDRKPARDSGSRPVRPAISDTGDALAATADVKAVAADRDGARVRAGTARNVSGLAEAGAAREADTVALGRASERPQQDDDVHQRATIDTARATRDPSATLRDPAATMRDPAATLPGRAPAPTGDEPRRAPAPSGDEPRRAPAPTGDEPRRAARRSDGLVRSTDDDDSPAVTLVRESDAETAPTRLFLGDPLKVQTPAPVVSRTKTPSAPPSSAAGRVAPSASADRGPQPSGPADRAAPSEDSADRAPLASDPPARVRAATITGSGEPRPAPVVRDRAASVVERLPTRDASVVDRLPTREPAATLPGRGPTADEAVAASPVRPRAATVPPMPARRPATAPPPLVAKRVEPSRTAGPPEPVDLENAITNPPPLRRTPSGQPAVPQDPAQLAAALAAVVSRVSAAPFGTAAPQDVAVTQPSLPVERATDAAVTQPSLPVERAIDDAAVTHPTLPAEPRPASTSAHPKPTRRAVTANPAPPTHLPGPVADDARITQPRAIAGLGADARVTATHDAEAADRFASSFDPKVDPKLDPKLDPLPRDPISEGGITEPSMPVLEVGEQRKVEVPLRGLARGLARTAPSSSPPHRKHNWASGLAARIDAAIQTDEWGHETPVVAPTRAELRALTGNPDPTRQIPIDEIELLQRRAAELAETDMPRRAPHPTAEVDPDDIEAAIELAPPARRTNANAIGAKPKKSE